VKLLRVLIVDDSSFMRKRLKDTLEKAGHQVVGAAQNGQEGYELFKKTKPDLVIMDVAMQGVDGIEGVRLIKRDFPHAKIIFMSLVEDPKIREEASRLNILGFIGKREHDKLLEIINELSL